SASANRRRSAGDDGDGDASERSIPRTQPRGNAANKTNQYETGSTVSMKFGKPSRSSAGARPYRTLWLSVARIPKPFQSDMISTPSACAGTRKNSTTDSADGSLRRCAVEKK